MTREYYQSLTTNMLCRDFGKCLKFTPPHWWYKFKPPDPLVLEYASNQPPMLFWKALAYREPKDRMFLPDPDNIGVEILVFSPVVLISNIVLLRAEEITGEPNEKDLLHPCVRIFYHIVTRVWPSSIRCMFPRNLHILYLHFDYCGDPNGTKRTYYVWAT